MLVLVSVKRVAKAAVRSCCCLARGGWLADSGGARMVTMPRGGTVEEHGHCGGAVVVGGGVAFPL